MIKLIEKIIGSYSTREIKRISPIADDIEALENDIKVLSDEKLKGKTREFKERLANGETLDDILVEAFAVVREASVRVLGMKHYYVQLIGGIVLHQGRIAEMKTGEGKTLAATLPVYLNALTGKGVHVVTVNDYLARRDSEWMGKIYNFLGMTVGLVVHGMTPEEKKQAYNSDITYGTNNEFGFDYLRDNMVLYKEEMVQRHLNYAIVDEVDSILVDEARTPLIISGAGDKSTELYSKAEAFVRRLKAIVFTETDDKKFMDDVDADYIVDEKAKSVTLTEEGIKKAENYFNVENLSDPENMTFSHHINQALKAKGMMKADREYIVKDGEIIIVDEFTGRLMYGRRYSDGLHQAIEAKERVKVERESKTLATITFQNYFRMYDKLAGMTGTALTEEQEFQTIYKLDVIEIPTNKEMIRDDLPDAIYRTEKGKLNAVVQEVAQCNERGQPVLIGTISIEKSELLSSMLKVHGISHSVLNAKHHEKEAEIVSQAGKYKTVTIATNMAGRGTDIVLGGNPEFMAKREMRKLGYDELLINAADAHYDTEDGAILDARNVFKEKLEYFKIQTDGEKKEVIGAGGLHIIGTERHESRRIDNQLRGRSGRQGDPGSSRFYISLEDDLMRLFGSDRLTGIVEALGLEEDQAIEHRMLTNAIENAQRKVEGKNFDIRKHVLQYDDVMNQQREIIYGQRKSVLDGENLKGNYLKMIETIIDDALVLYCTESPHPDNWDLEGLAHYLRNEMLTGENLDTRAIDYDEIKRETLKDTIMDLVIKEYESREKELGFDLMREVERVILLRVVDEKWMDHIDAMDQLRYGIGMRAYGQRDPVIEYKAEGHEMFMDMIRVIQQDSVKLLLKSRINTDRAPKREKVAEPVISSKEGDDVRKPVKSTARVGRNDPCPCGSGKKYKRCCGA